MSSQESEATKAEIGGGELRTERQSEDAAAASVELSIPTHVRQHDSAPKAVGYVLTEPLGSGAYGQVWRAWQLRTRKEVAVKVFTQRSGLDWIFLQREVERLARLDRHPHIVSLLDTGLDEEPPYYVMDVIDGGALQQFVNPTAPADRARAFAWMSQICDALSYVHGKGLIHCDLKPANILVDGRGLVRVVDFGQSRVFTESAASIGTLFYMAPEQAQLAEPGSLVQPDVRWDVYALGVSMFAILTGRVPYAREANIESLETAPTLADRLQRYRKMIADDPKPEWNGQASVAVDQELIAVVNKCMARQPDDRYSSVLEIEQDLQAIREQRPITPLSGSASYRSKKFLQRNPFQVVLAVAVVALAGLMAFGEIRQAQLDRATALKLMAPFFDDPADALSQVRNANDRVNAEMRDLIGRFVDSRRYWERILGARAGFLMDPATFWNSVDGGTLWEHGEWLELIDAISNLATSAQDSADLEHSFAELEAKLTDGSAREKYVALCVLVQLDPNRPGLAERFESLVSSASEPGLAISAAWAANKLGRRVQLASTDRIFVDDLTAMVFVELPPAKAFLRGSDAADPHRFADEDRPEQGVDIAAIYLATTEVTQSAFAGFFAEVMVNSTESEEDLPVIKNQFRGMTPDGTMRAAMGGMTLRTARRYCEWLNAKAMGASPGRTYRLPTEDEWEHAARAGNHTGRFCFGDNEDYARYFANCEGSLADRHDVAQRIPNFFGLSDMHGGLWEYTESVYPPEHAASKHQNQELFVKRGGGWYSPAVRCRSAQRNYVAADATDTSAMTGIRLVMEFAR